MFYIYAYIRENDSQVAPAGTPYYIGKGTKNRHMSPIHTVPVPKNKNLIVILEKNLTELGSLALERRYIKWYGRIDNRTGILRNMTDGGEGVCGRKHTQEEKEYLSRLGFGRKQSQETKDKKSKSLSGRKGHSKRTGCAHTEETKEKIREARKFQIMKPVSQETKDKKSKALKGKTHEEIYGIEESKRLKENLRRKAEIRKENKIKGIA